MDRRLGLIYIMRADTRAKIGWCAGDVHKRKAELQTGCPYPLEVLLTFAGTPEDEGTLHREFADLRVQGEWFRYEGRLVAFVARKLKPMRDTNRKAPHGAFIECVAAVGPGAEDPNPFHLRLPEEHPASLSVRPVPWDRSDAERLHKTGASGLAPVDADVVPPSGRDVLLVVRVHDEQTGQIAIRLEPREIDALVEALGGRTDVQQPGDREPSCV
jgi:hypothetical protein